MNQAIAPAIEQKGGKMHAIPKPVDDFTNGKIFDAHGDTVRPTTPTIMARLDQKASEKIELSRGTVWLIATALVLAGVIFSYGSSAIAWIRSDEGIRVNQGVMQKDMEEMRKDMDKLNGKFDELQKSLQLQREQDAVKRGYELKAAEGDHK